MDAVAGICPKSRNCVLVGIDDDNTWREIREGGFIAVPVSMEVARQLFLEPVDDVYAIAQLAKEQTP